MWRSTTTAFFIFFLSVFAGGLLLAQQTYTLSLNLVDKKLPFGLTQKVQTDLPQIGLALSGGGARCFSQLGVLKAFEEKNIPINIITGTSMGSIIGGLYSAGYSFDDLDSIVFTASWDDFFSIKERDRNELFVDKKILGDGFLSQAMRASSSVALLLAPVRRDSMLLVDGSRDTLELARIA